MQWIRLWHTMSWSFLVSPPPAATTLSYEILSLFHKQLKPLSPGSWAGDFISDCTLHLFYVVCTFTCLPSYLVGNFHSVFFCPTVHTVCSLDCPEPIPPPVYFNADCSILRSTGSVTWLLHHGLSPPAAESSCVEGF